MERLPSSTTRRENAGYSLIELMVGIVIGAVALVAIAQTVVVFDKHTQATSSGADAQMAGTLAMFNLERDIKQAGLGFGTAAAPTMGCDLQGIDTSAARPFNFPLSPVVIEPGAGGAPDTIHVLYGNPSYFVTAERFEAASSPSAKRLTRRGGFRPRDLAVVAGNATAAPASADCRLIEITANTPVNNEISHATGAYATAYAAASAVAKFNPTTGTGSTFLTGGGEVYNLGPEPQRNTWSVQGGRVLERRTWIDRDERLEVAENVVNLKAQYGIDSDADGRVDTWTNAAPTDWTQVLAIRLAVLVRSRQFERNGDPAASAAAMVTASVPTWSGAASSPFAMTDVTGGTSDSYSGNQNQAEPANWRFYRYRVYERVIPLRNTLWGQNSR